MPQTLVYLDTEGPIRAWVNSRSSLQALVSGTVCHFGWPSGRSMPVILMSLIGGAALGGDHPQEDVDISFSIWAAKKADAAIIAAALKSEINSLAPYTSAGVKLQSARTAQPIFQPDTSTDPDTPRYILDATFTCVAV